MHISKAVLKFHYSAGNITKEYLWIFMECGIIHMILPLYHITGIFFGAANVKQEESSEGNPLKGEHPGLCSLKQCYFEFWFCFSHFYSQCSTHKFLLHSLFFIIVATHCLHAGIPPLSSLPVCEYLNYSSQQREMFIFNTFLRLSFQKMQLCLLQKKLTSQAL